jgi:hypothetical protein
MIGSKALLCTLVLLIPLHGGPAPSPVPHWAVLLAVVPGLWLVIGGGVLAINRLLRRLESEERH